MSNNTTEVPRLQINIDPGVNYTGLSVTRSEIPFLVLETHLVKNNRAFTADEKVVEKEYGPRTVKIQAILNKLNELITRHNPDQLVIEAPFYNALTPAAYGSILEIIFSIKYTVTIPLGLKMALMEPTVVKKLFTTKGQAGKDVMRAFLESKTMNNEIIMPCEVSAISEHEVDSVAIGFVYHMTKQLETENKE